MVPGLRSGGTLLEFSNHAASASYVEYTPRKKTPNATFYVGIREMYDISKRNQEIRLTTFL